MNYKVCPRFKALLFLEKQWTNTLLDSHGKLFVAFNQEYNPHTWTNPALFWNSVVFVGLHHGHRISYCQYFCTKLQPGAGLSRQGLRCCALVRVESRENRYCDAFGAKCVNSSLQVFTLLYESNPLLQDLHFSQPVPSGVHHWKEVQGPKKCTANSSAERRENHN